MTGMIVKKQRYVGRARHGQNRDDHDRQCADDASGRRRLGTQRLDLTMHLLAIRDGPEVLGCDIDPQAVAWANEHLKPGAFTRVDAKPPTPYESRSFDVIISYSVLTHLTRDAQASWLREMERLLRTLLPPSPPAGGDPGSSTETG